jgi:hypothetical protein
MRSQKGRGKWGFGKKGRKKIGCQNVLNPNSINKIHVKLRFHQITIYVSF